MDHIDGWVVREFGPKDAEQTALFLPGALASHVFIEDVAAVPELGATRIVGTTLRDPHREVERRGSAAARCGERPTVQ